VQYTPRVEVEGIGFAVDDSPVGRRPELAAQATGDGLADRALDRENVAQGPVVASRPQPRSVARADEVGVDADAIALSTNAALEHVIDVQPFGDVAEIRVFAELCRRGASGDTELRLARQPVEDFLADTLGEICVLGGEVAERQHRD